MGEPAPHRRRVGAGADVLGRYPLGMTDFHDPTPRAEVTQALDVIHRLVPPRTVVINDDEKAP